MDAASVSLNASVPDAAASPDIYPSNQDSFDARAFPSALRSCIHCPQLDPPRTITVVAVAALESNNNSINEAANEQRSWPVFIYRLSYAATTRIVHLRGARRTIIRENLRLRPPQRIEPRRDCRFQH